MESKLFGVPMPKKRKIRVIICIVLFCICCFMYFFLALFEKEEVVIVTMPTSGLSQSIFDSQNTSYTKQEEYPLMHVFSTLPYSVDVPEVQSANVGDGWVYYSYPYYYYVSELAEDGDILECFKEQITPIISMNADWKSTSVSVAHEEKGYVNGCASTFYVGEVQVADAPKGVFVLYRLHLDESIYETEQDMLIGCFDALEYSTENLSELTRKSYNVIRTLNFNKEQSDRLERLENEQ